jgi:hypothetical protein
MKFCATSEFRQIRLENEFVFSRQVGSDPYLSGVADVTKVPWATGEFGAPAMTIFHQFNTFAASRGEGLHPKLRTLFQRIDASPFSEISMRRDGLVQAGPSPNSEVVSRAEVCLFPPELARGVVVASKPKMLGPSTANAKPDGIA